MRSFLITGLLAAAFLIAPGLSGQALAEMVQDKCPVMGYQPNAELYTDYKGKRIYFCCASCPEEFKKDPEKYLKKLKEQGVELEDAPKG